MAKLDELELTEVAAMKQASDLPQAIQMSIAISLKRIADTQEETLNFLKGDADMREYNAR